jgi:ribosome-associated toxin RatA of RatAB toxin-antitoxin module
MTMRRIQRSALVAYSAQQMFDLVDDVAAYPDFLPWCVGAEIEKLEGDEMVATLDVRRSGIRQQFTTRNLRQRPETIGMQLEAGPFSTLHGGWQFRPLDTAACKVIFELEFEFASSVVGVLFAPVFEEITGSMVAAFVERARAVYGALA